MTRPRLTRRGLLMLGAAACWVPWVSPRAAFDPVMPLPRDVAGVSIPRSRYALLVTSYARAHQPEFLFNHCMRTYLFGALYAKKTELTFDADEAFGAAALHDLGLLPAFASENASFELDGAAAAERYARSIGLSPHQADMIWHGVEMHDGNWPLTLRQGGEAAVVSFGAVCDVDGPDNAFVDEREVADIVAAFPRLQFKTRFTALLVDHCRRKPLSQRSTWLEDLCRRTTPSAWTETTEHEIDAAPFAE